MVFNRKLNIPFLNLKGIHEVRFLYASLKLKSELTVFKRFLTPNVSKK